LSVARDDELAGSGLKKGIYIIMSDKNGNVIGPLAVGLTKKETSERLSMIRTLLTLEKYL